MLLVLLFDQLTKWWAWRHTTSARINPGGDGLVGARIDLWFTHPWGGALLDVLDAGLLAGALWLLCRRPRSPALLISAVGVLGGLVSDLADRLGLHYWTAPGSMRGAIDFIPIGQHHFNVADLLLIAAAPVLLTSWIRAHRRSAGDAPPAPPERPSSRQAAVAGVVTIVVLAAAANGAVHHGWLSVPEHVINNGQLN